MKDSLASTLSLIAMAMQVAAAPCPSQTFAAKNGDHLRAMIYRGKSSCEGCPESVQALLETAYPTIVATFAGPDEEIKIIAENLRQVDIFVQPGGPLCTPPYVQSKRVVIV
jgi:hypothetical protein